MRVFALSDLHVDFAANSEWVRQLSSCDYVDDVLILAGDVTHDLDMLARHLTILAERFHKVLFVPGNHELWVAHERGETTSIQKFRDVMFVAQRSGACTAPYRLGRLIIVPLLSWYDYSFGAPTEKLRSMWTDFFACRWPPLMSASGVADYMDGCCALPATTAEDTVISFSHFMPRTDLLTPRALSVMSALLPVLGSERIERRIRELQSSMHVYGHSHLNRRVSLDGVTYINNALGYPREQGLAARKLVCIHES